MNENKNIVKDFEEIEVNQNEENIEEEDKREAFAYDSDEALFVTLVADCSISVEQIGGFTIMNELMPTILKEVAIDDDAKAKIKLAIIRYGSDVEVVSDFKPIYEYDKQTKICEKGMGATDTAAALDKAFEMTDDAFVYYQQNLGANVLGGIVILLTDDLPTSAPEKMKEMAAKYKNYTRGSNGERRIKIIAITCSDEAFDNSDEYANEAYNTEDFSGFVDAVKTEIKKAKKMTTLTGKYNEAGESSIDTSIIEPEQLPDNIQYKNLDFDQTL